MSGVEAGPGSSRPTKTRHQKAVSETRRWNASSLAKFPTRRPSGIRKIPRYRAVLRGLRTLAGGDRTGWLAGVRGLELGNVALQNASPTKSLGCQNVMEKQGVQPRFQKTDISEFESSHPSHGVGLCGLMSPVLKPVMLVLKAMLGLAILKARAASRC
jgi:hypothetical protein